MRSTEPKRFPVRVAAVPALRVAEVVDELRARAERLSLHLEITNF